MSSNVPRGRLSEDAIALNERGRELNQEGRDDEAVSAYRAAIEADPTWSVPWYNLGLLHKYRGEWPQSAECSLKAVELDDSDQAAWWNLGIASTASDDWPQAREAWARCGIGLPEGKGPIEEDFGLTPIRLDPLGRGEVVWCDRIDPARAIIRNMPLPESGHRFGDLLLHDGAPNGSRVRNGEEVPVFDSLGLLRQSEYLTYILDIPGSTEEQRSLLSDVALGLGRAAEDWSQSVSFLCRRCSEGTPHERHDNDLRNTRPELAVAAAARDSSEIAELVGVWKAKTGFDGYVGFTCVGNDT